MTEIIRRCIDRALDEGEASRRRSYLRACEVVGAFRDSDGREDISERYDDYLDIAFE